MARPGGIAAVEVAAHELLVDDRHLGSVHAIAGGKLAPEQQTDAHRAEVVRTDGVVVVIDTYRRVVAVDAHSRPRGPATAKRQRHAARKRGGLNAGECANAIDDPLDCGVRGAALASFHKRHLRQQRAVGVEARPRCVQATRCGGTES